MFINLGHITAQFPQIGNDIYGESFSDNSGWSTSLSSNGQILAIGAPRNAGNGLLSGHVRIYEWNGSSWIQKGNDIDGESFLDKFGHSVSLSSDGNILAIGAINNNGNGTEAGHVRIYEWNGSSWIQKGNDIDGEFAYDYSGYDVSISANGNIIAIGSLENDGTASKSGHVRIFEWNGNSWVQKGNDIDGTYAYGSFGFSISLSNDGNVVAIGGSHEGPNLQGQVHIYEWTGTSWTQKGNIIVGETVADYSGSVSLSADGNIVAIGAFENIGNGNNSGHVRIFEWNGFNWIQKGLDINGENTDDNFGWSVSLSENGNVLAAGAISNDENGINAGHVRIYKWNGTDWFQLGLDIDGKNANEYSGCDVNLNSDGNIVAIGAYGNNAGNARVFRLRGVYGQAFMDFNQNCIKDNLEIGLASRNFILNPGNIILQTGTRGSWYIDSLPAGNYTITADTSSANWTLTCPPTQSFTVIHPDSITFAPYFGFDASNPCTAPEISIHAPFLRPGFSGQYVYVRACNQYSGTEIMDSVYVIVELDSLLTVDSVSLSYTNLGNNRYLVNLDTLFPGQCKDFWLSSTLSMNAVLGQTLCMNAWIYPLDSCVLDTVTTAYGLGNVSPCTLPWDRSSLRVEGSCINDSVRFVVYNTGIFGNGDMDCFAPVRLYQDGVWVLLDSIQLQGGDSIVFMFAGNGQTWRLEADQHPLHPGNSHPNATIENCGTGTWTPDLVNVLPMDDADPFVDIYCGLVTGSYDPNDKTGYPLGIGSTHDVLPNQEIEYLIRFQNTGTDTAFTVVIRDTLSMDFDIFSVRSGAASNDYSFRMYGPRVLEWTFSNIMLPDSNVNEAGSHGFVKFNVKQQRDLVNGTVLENSAAIYFDFNAPIYTNISSHTVNQHSIILNTDKQVDYEKNTIKIYPNPTAGILQIEQKDNNALNIKIYDNLGRLVLQKQSNSSISNLDISNLTDGIYFIAIKGDNEFFSSKILKR
jgi:uncharacterized repeat protein (TIGR01451 family)